VSTPAFRNSRAGTGAQAQRREGIWADVHAGEKVSRVEDLGPRGLGKGTEFPFMEENWITSFWRKENVLEIKEIF
jgi:hypothetical protein